MRDLQWDECCGRERRNSIVVDRGDDQTNGQAET